MSIWHHNTIQEFAREIHRKHLTDEDFDDEILFEEEDYWASKKVNKSKFLLSSDNYKDLPIIYRNPLDEQNKNFFEKVYLNNRTHYLIKSIKRAVIEPKKTMQPYEFFEKFADIPHSKPLHWNLYKGICIAGNFTKIMTRISAKREFGKSSIPTTLRDLTKQTRLIIPASFPALLRKLSSTKMVFITEPKEFEGFDTFLEIVGDRANHFENPKVESKGAGTQNEYDVSQLSILLGYNRLEEYKDKEDKFFDNVFRTHILSRFIPFMLDGNIKHFKQEKYNDESHDLLLEWLRNWNYYKMNWEKSLHGYSIDLSSMNWGIRYIETFNEIIRIFDFISKDEQEFDGYIDELIKCHLAYNRMINGQNITLQETSIPKKVERIKEHELKVTEEFIYNNIHGESAGFSEALATNSEMKESPLFSSSNSHDKGEINTTNFVSSPPVVNKRQSPLDFIREKDKGIATINEFINNYDEKTLKKLLSDGNIFEIEGAKIKVLE